MGGILAATRPQPEDSMVIALTSNAKTIEEFRREVVTLLKHRADMYLNQKACETSKKRKAELETARQALLVLADEVVDIVLKS